MAVDPWAKILENLPAENGGGGAPAADPMALTALMRANAPLFDGANLRAGGPLLDRIPTDADDPGYRQRQWSMGAGAMPEPEQGATSAVEYPQQAETLVLQSTVGGVAAPAVERPRRRVVLSWGRDPGRIIVGIEDVATGDLETTVAVSVGAWQELAGLISRLVHVKDLTGGEWREAYDVPRNQPRRRAPTAGAAAGGPRDRPGRTEAAPARQPAGGRRRAPAAAADRGRDDPAGRTNGRASAADDGADVPPTDAAGGAE